MQVLQQLANKRVELDSPRQRFALPLLTAHAQREFQTGSRYRYIDSSKNRFRLVYGDQKC